VPQALFVAFFPFCCNLLALWFCVSSAFGDAYFNSVAPFCSNVLHPDISYCTQLTDDIADELVEGMTQLRTLNISGTDLSDVFINILTAHYSHSLQSLYASSCDFIEEGLEVLITTSELLHTLECSYRDIDFKQPDAMHNVTTLLLVDDRQRGLIEAVKWVTQHREHLEQLRIASYNLEILSFDDMTQEALPRLQTLVVCCQDAGKKEPDNLQELRKARPNVHVYYNKDVLAYDLMKLPLHYDP